MTFPKPKDLLDRADPEYLRELCRLLIRTGYGPHKTGFSHLGPFARASHEKGREDVNAERFEKGIENLKKAAAHYRNMIHHGLTQEEPTLNLVLRDIVNAEKKRRGLVG